MKWKVTPFQPPDILGSSWFAGFFFALSRMSPYFPLPSTFTKRCYVPILCKTFNVRDYVNNLTSKKCTNVYQISYLFIYFNSCYNFPKVHFLVEKTHPNLWIPLCWLRFLLIPLCTPSVVFLHQWSFMFLLHRWFVNFAIEVVIKYAFQKHFTVF